RRIDRLLDSRVSELPAVLAGNPGLESGYMLAQYTAAALVSENKGLAHPASVDSIPTGAGVEDHVSMAPIAARHARQIVDNVARVVALELLCGCRALEFRRPMSAGVGTERLYAAIRRIVPPPDGDRPLSGACETVARWVLSPAPEKPGARAARHREELPRLGPGSGAPHADEQPRRRSRRASRRSRGLWRHRQ